MSPNRGLLLEVTVDVEEWRVERIARRLGFRHRFCQNLSPEEDPELFDAVPSLFGEKAFNEERIPGESHAAIICCRGGHAVLARPQTDCLFGLQSGRVQVIEGGGAKEFLMRAVSAVVEVH